MRTFFRLTDNLPSQSLTLFHCCFSAEDVPEWERELQAELQEYEVVNDGNTLEDEDLEKEILKQIEAEANES